MKKRKIIIIISDINFSYGLKWAAEFLDKDKFEQIYVFLNENKPDLFTELLNDGFKCHFISHKSKKDILISFIKIFNIIRTESPDIVHAHLFNASLLGLFAAKLLHVKKCIYTRHHSTQHHVYFPKMVKYDRFINSNATDIIAISENVKSVLLERELVPTSKIKIVNHGFDLDAFSYPNKKIVEVFKKDFGLDGRYPVIGVISRFTYWKGVQDIVKAFNKLLINYPNAKLILANAKGDYSSEIIKMLDALPENSWISIPFEKNIFALYALFDIFVHVPINSEAEAFGQTYVEALASSVPSIFTLSGIAREFIVHNYNALVVPFQDEKAILKELIYIIENHDQISNIVKQGLSDVHTNFGLQTMKIALENLYNE